MKDLNNKQQKIIKDTYNHFEYLASNVNTDIKKAYTYFKKDRDLSKRELELVILNNFYMYETKLRNNALKDEINTDFGLLGLFGAFERVRSVTGFEKLVNKLDAIHNIYLERHGFKRSKYLSDCTLKVRAKEWFDNVNGNSYFSANIYIDDEFITSIPFSYGYGTYYEQATTEKLKELNLIPDNINTLWKLKENNVNIDTSIQENCKQREVKNFAL